jgi:hypothetical protein
MVGPTEAELSRVHHAGAKTFFPAVDGGGEPSPNR